MVELVGSKQQLKFGRDKLDTLPRYCTECEVRFACHGECPKNRFLTTPHGEPGLNYLCAGYKAFFHHIDRPIKIMAALLRRGRPAAQVMSILVSEDVKLAGTFAKARRNDPCPCGSGLKFKRCHGREETVKDERAQGNQRTGPNRGRKEVRRSQPGQQNLEAEVPER